MDRRTELFVWPAPPPEPERYHMGPVETLGLFDRAAATMYSPAETLAMSDAEARAAEREVLGVVLDQLRARKPAEPSLAPPQPDIVVEGEIAGVRWGHKRVPAQATEIRFEVYERGPSSVKTPGMAPEPIRGCPTTITFRRCTFIDGRRRFTLFATEGIDLEQIGAVLARSNATALAEAA